MSCGNKLKYTCGDSKSNARCVFYDLKVPEYSKLVEENCRTIEETTDDLYKLMTWVRESIDLEDFDTNCLEVSKVSDSYEKRNSRYLVKDVLASLRDEVCNMKNGSSSNAGGINDSYIINQLDLTCLGLDKCDPKPSTLAQLLQLIINVLCQKTR